jgi:hypothetical protein
VTLTSSALKEEGQPVIAAAENVQEPVILEASDPAPQTTEAADKMDAWKKVAKSNKE